MTHMASDSTEKGFNISENPSISVDSNYWYDKATDCK